jgi:hypothetical protein
MTTRRRRQTHRRRSIRRMKGGEYKRYAFKFEIAAQMQTINQGLLDVVLSNLMITDNNEKIVKKFRESINRAPIPGVRNVMVAHLKDSTFVIVGQLDRAMNVPPNYRFRDMLEVAFPIDLDIRDTIQHEPVVRQYIIHGVLGDEVHLGLI